MLWTAGLHTTVHSHDFPSLGVMILVNTTIRLGLLTQFKSLLIESTSNSEPSLIVEEWVTRLELDFSIFSLKTSIFHFPTSACCLNEDFVAGDRNKNKSLSWIHIVALIDVHFVGSTINRI